MFDVMSEVAETSLQMLGRDLWNQINGFCAASKSEEPAEEVFGGKRI